ncbi:universal stress protein [Thermodesulfobacteriota bacterium]
MKTFQKLMAAIDLSLYSNKVLKHAYNLAEDLKAELVVVHVINQRDIDAIQQVSSYINGFSLNEYIEAQKKQRLHFIEKVISTLNTHGIAAPILFRTGVPFKELIQAIEDLCIDIAVMGTKGRGHIAGVLFGSVAEKMFRHCPVPLLSIKEQ